MREVLLFAFNSKKSAAGAHRMIVDTYDVNTISEGTCRVWFQHFNAGNFGIEDNERPGQVKKFEDSELEALLEKDSCQTQQKLADSLNVTQQTISHRLKHMGMVKKQGHWVPHTLNQETLNADYSFANNYYRGKKRKGFLHRIVTGDEKWILYGNPRRKKSWGYHGHASISTPKPNIHGSKILLCIQWDQHGVIYYQLLKPGETITGA